MRLYVRDRKPIFQKDHWSAAPRKPRQRTARHISGTGGCGSSAAPRRQRFRLEAVPRDRSFDHLVGERKQCRWDFEAQRLGSLEIDDEFELDRLQHRKARRLLAHENSRGINAGLAIGIDKINAVTHQAAGRRMLAKLVHGWHFVPRCERNILVAVATEEWI